MNYNTLGIKFITCVPIGYTEIIDTVTKHTKVA